MTWISLPIQQQAQPDQGSRGHDKSRRLQRLHKPVRNPVAGRSRIPGCGLLPLHHVPEAGVHELSGCTANLQVGPGIFAGIHQVTGGRCPYAYCRLW